MGRSGKKVCLPGLSAEPYVSCGLAGSSAQTGRWKLASLILANATTVDQPVERYPINGTVVTRLCSEVTRFLKLRLKILLSFALSGSSKLKH